MKHRITFKHGRHGTIRVLCSCGEWALAGGGDEERLVGEWTALHRRGSVMKHGSAA